MGLKELKEELDNDVKNILGTDFTVTISETKLVPSINDTNITYPNLDQKVMKAKRIHTCVLYIDIRKSTELNLKHYPHTLTKLYGAFMRSMVKAAQYHKGKVRNIIGDRVMVVFDEEDCFKNAVNTAILLNSVSLYVLNKHFKNNEVTCGIGVDYGRMLVSKGGIVKNGDENAPYKSLVWLGRPANVASKLTDLANKEVEIKSNKIESYIDAYCYAIPNLPPKFSTITTMDFFTNVLRNKTDIQLLTSGDGTKYFASNIPFYNSYYPRTRTIQEVKKTTTPSILMTQIVFDEYKKACPTGKDVIKELWKIQDDKLYQNYTIYGGNVIFTDMV
jgi:class 3 adenylate cyclase